MGAAPHSNEPGVGYMAPFRPSAWRLRVQTLTARCLFHHCAAFLSDAVAAAAQSGSRLEDGGADNLQHGRNGADVLMKVLGISAYFHDSSAALVIDGEVVAAAQEERFSRLKHDSGLPIQAVRFCLQQAGL